GAPLSGTEGVDTGTVQLATFKHANGIEPATDFAATIHWGDGTTSAGTVTQLAGAHAPYAVLGSHAYAEDGNFAISVEVTEDGGATDTGVVFVNMASIAEDAITLSSGADVSGVEGVSTDVVT